MLSLRGPRLAVGGRLLKPIGDSITCRTNSLLALCNLSLMLVLKLSINLLPRLNHFHLQLSGKGFPAFVVITPRELPAHHFDGELILFSIVFN